MSELYDTLRKLIRQETASLRTAELAVVQEVYPADPDNYACDLALRDSQLVLKHRITSYNVCYTKLLRRTSGQRNPQSTRASQ